MKLIINQSIFHWQVDDYFEIENTNRY